MMAQLTQNPDEDFENFLRKITSKLAELKDPVSKLEQLSTEKEKKKWLKGEEEKLVRYFTKELQRLMEMVKPVPDKAKTVPATTQDQRPREKQKDVVAQGSPKPGMAQQMKPSTSSTSTQNRQKKPDGTTKKAALRRVNAKVKSPQTGESLSSSKQPISKRHDQKATEQNTTSTAMNKSDKRNTPEDGPSLEDSRIEELNECHRQIEELQRKKQEAEKTADERKSKINALKKDLQDMKDAHAINEKEFKGLMKRAQEADKTMQERDSEISSLKKQLDDLYNKLRNREESLGTKDSKIRELDDKLSEQMSKNENMKQKIGKVEAQKNEWMNKFGKLASDKVESSPDVTDLGDPDRALKLAERYKDMYDNIWTKTYMAQRRLKKFHEKHIVKNLLDILTGAFSYCKQLAQAQESSLRNLLLHPIQENISGAQMKPIDIKPQQHQKMKELRKQWAAGTSAVEEVKQAYLADEYKKLEQSQSDAREKDYDKTDLVKRMDVSKDFYRKCAEVCWLMVLHEPPLYLEVNIKQGDPCDRDLYTMRSDGDQVKTLVWPPLFQGKGGGLLAQGVVEGQKSVKRSDV